MRATSAIMLIVIGAAFAAVAASADAGVTTAEIKNVEAAPAPNAALPLDLGFVDDAGRSLTLRDVIGPMPSVLIFVDYTCRSLCGPTLEFVASGLAKTGLKPGTEYRLIAIGLDPRDELAAARTMRAEHIGSTGPISGAAMFLTGNEAAIGRVTQAAGLHYVYDVAHDQYAHPAAVYVIDATGKVRRELSPLGLDGADLRLAIVDAGRGAVGTLADRIHLLCYGYDPVKGIYTERITSALAVAAGITLIILLTAVAMMVARERRSRPS